MSEYDYDAQYSALLVRFEDFFQSIKNLSNISAELLSVIKSNPTNASAEALTTSALNQVQASPQHVDSLVVAIKNLLDTIDESIEIADEYGSSRCPSKMSHIIGRSILCYRYQESAVQKRTPLPDKVYSCQMRLKRRNGKRSWPLVPVCSCQSQVQG